MPATIITEDLYEFRRELFEEIEGFIILQSGPKLEMGLRLKNIMDMLKKNFSL